jgi:hypothetical protein
VVIWIFWGLLILAWLKNVAPQRITQIGSIMGENSQLLALFVTD